MDRNRVIGKQNQLPWKLSSDLRLFKKLTLGLPVLMGRKTWESIGRPLPGRLNLVLTRQRDFSAAGVEVVHTIEEALEKSSGRDRVFVIGGEEIYRLCIPLASRMFISHVDAAVEGGDAFFPDFDPGEYHVIDKELFSADEKNEYDFRFIEYAKKNPTL